MVTKSWTPNELWERLYKSNNVKAELDNIYTADFFIDFATLFDRHPHPYALFKGVYDTAEAYLVGKREKAALQSELLKHSGVHLMKAGQAAQELQYFLTQLSKSKLAEAVLHKNLGEHLETSAGRGRDALKSAEFRNGPSDPLAFLQELSDALAKAANDILPLPDEDEGELETRRRAMAFVNQFNANRAASPKKPTVNHALRSAATTFRPTWEKHSRVLYSKGRCHFDLGRYVSKPAQALHRIISRIDSRVPESLVGTAIENIRLHL